MIIGFLGKGGSGKSTLSSNMALYLARQGKRVLAVDADHNMDMTFNLGVTEEFPYLGSAMYDLKKHTRLSSDENYREALFRNEEGTFSLSPKDEFTNHYAKEVAENLSLMTAGPQTDDVLADRSCSHILFTTLKVYLPLLKLNEDEWVVIDEKAGADGVSTGIPTGFDLAFIVTEPTVHSMKTAKQLAGLLDHYGVPYEFVVNKAMDSHSKEALEAELGKEPIVIIGFDQSFASFDGSYMETLFAWLTENRGKFVGKRLERSKKKFEERVSK